nr:ABC transporter ATP-binding protein [Feifania hominis]
MIRVNNVYKVYHPGEENEVRALDGVSIRIDYGEFVAILGSSGSGKSTLMNMLGCLDTPTLGEYYLAGENVSELSDNKLSEIRNKQIGFIFQGYNLIKDLTALENVELPLTYRGMHKEERRRLSTEALERVELSRRMKHLPSQMSGGQQQRVAIARAVAARPPIIMADEPTGNLDSKSGAQVMKILKELNAEGTTVILITHDNEIAKQAKRVIRIHDGKVVDDYMVEEAVS